ncbi:hypothetical protein IJ818_04665 [bacterium]|nr:hypothetical protein [bacterium]
MDKYGNNRIKTIIEYIEKQGIKVNTNTKARGHQGFFINGRIDISKNTPENRVIPTLLHEFSHYIHSLIEPSIAKTGGDLKILFNEENDCSKIFEELVKVTNFVDENSLHKKLSYHQEQIKNKIKELDKEIKKEYPNFQRSKKFKELEKAVKKTNAKYFLKYDRVKIKGWLFQKSQILSIDNIEKDFPELKPSVTAFIRLKSYQKKQTRIAQRINKLDKYYKRPTELFARFVEGIYIDNETVKNLAPISYERFYNLLENGYYKNLKTILEKLK